MKTRTSTSIKELKSDTNDYLSKLNLSLRLVQDNYDSDVLRIKKDIIHKISTDYSINLDELENRYLKQKKNKSKKVESISSFDQDSESEDYNIPNREYIFSNKSEVIEKEHHLLFKTVYDNKNYYIDMIDNGNVYDSDNNIVGLWINNEMVLNKTLKRKDNMTKLIDNLISEQSITLHDFDIICKR